MTIRRVVPNIEAADPTASLAFYVDVLGLEVAMDMGWIITFASPSNATAQVSVTRTSDTSGPHPDISVEVSDVNTCHARAVARGCLIAYPLTDEPWGVRRFFVHEPNGKIINVLSHRAAE